MRQSDLPQVIKIEQSSFSRPWSANYFRQELTSNQVAHYLVACQDQMILGYLGIWLIAEEATITNIAVRRSHRHRGIGELLLISAIDFTLEHGAKFLKLEVEGPNLAAQHLFGKYGFIVVGWLHHGYIEKGKDVLIMKTENITTPFFRSNVERLKKSLVERKRASFVPTT